MHTIVALGGNSGKDAANSYMMAGAKEITLVERDPVSAKMLKRQTATIPRTTVKVNVKHGDLMDHLPRRGKGYVVDIDCECSIMSPDIINLMPATKGRNYLFTTSFRTGRNGLNLHGIANRFCELTNQSRTHGLMPLFDVHNCINSAGRIGNVKEYHFDTTEGNTYAMLLYRDGQHAGLMVIITPINK